MSLCRNVLILLLKHFMVRRRRFINTAIEYLLPLLMMSFVTYAKAFYLLAICLTFALLVVFEFLMSRLMAERMSGAQELLKMVGVTTTQIGISHLLNMLPGAILFSVIGTKLIKITFQYNFFVIFLVLFLQFMFVVAFASACSYIVETHNSGFLAFIIYLVSSIGGIVVAIEKYDQYTGVLPFVPGLWFSRAVDEYENTGTTNKTRVALVFTFLLLQTFIYFMLAWYLSFVRRGKHGNPLPWDFLFRKEYWSKNKPRQNPPTKTDEREENVEAQYFEALPKDSEVGIRIEDLTKVYDDYFALSHVSLPVLKDEITILLGHNGAGKTTLMSIITGMTAATQGKVYVNGLDTASQQTAVRSQLGFCPQHSLFYVDLTVIQHVNLFYLLKDSKLSVWGDEVLTSSLKLLSDLGLRDKANVMTNQLSGGMQRRLQLACALAGDASVLVLDEPTAGLDVETRRGLWDLLLSLRSGRTVLISTHFMEEADALGDRVVALHSGTLRCHATPMHLKKEIDTGYRLTITLNPDVPVAEVGRDLTELISSILPLTTQLSESGDRTLAYKLPSRQSDKFPGLFKKLEDNQSTLGIETIGVGVSTLEEVFWKLCSDTSDRSDEVDVPLEDTGVMPRVLGAGLVWQQFVALFLRQLRYSISTWKSFLIMQVAVPIVLIFVLVMEVDILWNSHMSCVLQAVLTTAAVLPTKERQTQARHNQLMAGCCPELHWLTSLLYNVTSNFLFFILPTVVALACKPRPDNDMPFNPFSQPMLNDKLGEVILALTMSSLAFVSMAFLVSFVFRTPQRAISILVVLSFVFSYVPTTINLFGSKCNQKMVTANKALNALSYIFTPYTIATAFKITTQPINAIDCSGKIPTPKNHLIVLFVHFLIYMVLVCLKDRGILGYYYNRLLNADYLIWDRRQDEVIAQEESYVKEALREPKDDALLVSAVHKRYPKLLCGAAVSAVQGVSFAVHEGECFGLVGVNGAGKSTTFKMLTCETFPTSGQLMVGREPQRIFDNTKYLKNLGYCPQFSGLDEFLTGRQNLELLLTLDGLAAADARREAVRWLELIDLMKYADRPLSAYSGGCGRRLCSVAALARRAGLSLLDEPTAGVDVAARRRLWRAVRAAQHMPAAGGGRRAVLITSHSMDEMEALCGRVGIMSAGVLCALGAPAALRAQHHAGRALAIKIKNTGGTTNSSDHTAEKDKSDTVELQNLKKTCLDFQWTPKEEHKTMLHYHVAKELKMEYSELFTKLEELRSAFPALVEDYAVTETTLEQVFLSYAKSPTGGV